MILLFEINMDSTEKQEAVQHSYVRTQDHVVNCF